MSVVSLFDHSIIHKFPIESYSLWDESWIECLWSWANTHRLSVVHYEDISVNRCCEMLLGRNAAVKQCYRIPGRFCLTPYLNEVLVSAVKWRLLEIVARGMVLPTLTLVLVVFIHSTSWSSYELQVAHLGWPQRGLKNTPNNVLKSSPENHSNPGNYLFVFLEQQGPIWSLLAAKPQASITEHSDCSIWHLIVFSNLASESNLFSNHHNSSFFIFIWDVQNDRDSCHTTAKKMDMSFTKWTSFFFLAWYYNGYPIASRGRPLTYGFAVFEGYKLPWLSLYHIWMGLVVRIDDCVGILPQ